MRFALMFFIGGGDLEILSTQRLPRGRDPILPTQRIPRGRDPILPTLLATQRFRGPFVTNL